jgi:hypothetical protein
MEIWHRNAGVKSMWENADSAPKARETDNGGQRREADAGIRTTFKSLRWVQRR